MPKVPLYAFFLGLLTLVCTLHANDGRRSSRQPEGLRENVPQVFAIVGGDVVVRPGETIEKATIVVRDGIIVAVGQDAEVPPAARRVDVLGRRIYAGFIDSFAELPSEASSRDPALADLMGANYWNSQVTPQIDAARILPDPGEAHLRLRQAGFTARLYAPSAGLVRGTAALVSTREGVGGDEAVLSSPVGQVVQLHTQRRRGGGFPGSPMGAMTLVRQAMYDAQWYAEAAGLPGAERNDALAALLPAVSGDVKVIFDCRDELYALRADKVAREFGLEAVLVGSGQEYRRADLVAEAGRAVIVPINFPQPPDVTTPERADAVTLDALLHWDLAPGNAGMLVDRGTRIALTTRGLRRIDREFWPNLRRAVRRGLDPDAALAALTSDAAEILGVAGRMGTVEVGKVANLVVADGDLFAADSRSRVVEVWVDGHRHVIVRDGPFDARGTWRLGEAPVGFSFRITGQPDALRGVVVREVDPPDDTTNGPVTRPATGPTTQPRQVELRNLRASGDNVSFTVAGGGVGLGEGVVRVSLTKFGDELRGVADLPDGRRVSVRSRQTAPPATGPVAEREAVEVEAEAATVDPEIDSEMPGEIPTEEDPEGTTPVVPEGEPAEPEGVEIEVTPADEAAPTTRPTDAALFEPNYPLGAFGRESPEAPPQPSVVFFHDVTIWPSDGREPFLGSVRVEDGRIVGLIDGALQSLPGVGGIEGAVIINGDGGRLHLTPGLIDCHSHIATDGGINEGTRAITCHVRIADFINPDDINLYRQLAGGITSANILHGSANPIGGQNAVIKFRWGGGPDDLLMEEAPPGVKFALGENVKQSNWATDGSRYPQTRMGVPELIADAFRRALDYRRAKEDHENNGGLPVRHDLELEALLEMLDGERLIHCHSYRQDEILALIRVLDDFNVTVGSFQHILEGYKVAREMAEHGATASAFSDWWAFKFEVYDAIPYAGAIMHDAGIIVSFNSDDPELARRMNLEAAKAVKYGGVPPHEALQFVTLNPAKQLAIDAYVGSIEEGKHADLVLWSGDPLSTFSRVEQTWIDGRRYFDRAEDADARRTAADMRNQLIQRVLASGERPAAPGETPPRESEMWPNINEYCAEGCYIHR